MTDNCITDGTAEVEAEKALRTATKAAEAAVSKALQAAALAGLEYAAPHDMQIEAPRSEKVCHSADLACTLFLLQHAANMYQLHATACLKTSVSILKETMTCILSPQAFIQLQVDGRLIERKASAAQQSMLQRAQRREKAQANAAAAQAQMLAAQQVERQSSQRSRHDQGGPATLQQVCAMHCQCTLAADTC